MSSSPANCPTTLAVTSVSDYDGLPGAIGTPANETDLDDTFTDFSNWGNNGTASRTIAGPGKLTWFAMLFNAMDSDDGILSAAIGVGAAGFQ